MESSPDMITRKELDESLERVMNNVLLEMKLFREHTDTRFLGIEARFDRIESRLDRQAGLIQSGARALLRIDRWADASDNRIAELSDQIRSLETRLVRLESRP
jgi:hypothetical protein